MVKNNNRAELSLVSWSTHPPPLPPKQKKNKQKNNNKKNKKTKQKKNNKEKHLSGEEILEKTCQAPTSKKD